MMEPIMSSNERDIEKQKATSVSSYQFSDVDSKKGKSV